MPYGRELRPQERMPFYRLTIAIAGISTTLAALFGVVAVRYAAAGVRPMSVINGAVTCGLLLTAAAAWCYALRLRRLLDDSGV